MKSNKYFTKELLVEANNAAIREKRNQTIKEEIIETLDDDMLFPICHFFYHAKNEIRVMVVLDYQGTWGLLDMSMLRYESLPTSILNDDGSVTLEDEESYNSRRPYPNTREWQESFVLKPVRRQKSFRDDVLKAYNNQCAVCSINNTKVLRAAHIWPVSYGGTDEIQNGICLCVTHEVAYDSGLFSITPEGDVILNTRDDLKIEYLKIRYPDNLQERPSISNLLKRNEFFSNK
ncbi:HNH endonuclease [Paenibacillus barengoltzii]|uniref:HNH endonuclease n=1 Tax=Paenibacillus barengoltzii TaxID=343517 RepID=UPI002FD9EE2F